MLCLGVVVCMNVVVCLSYLSVCIVDPGLCTFQGPEG